MAELVIHPNLFTIPRRRSLQSVPPLLRADQAEQRYNDAVQAAVEKCGADTAGQTCFICMDGAAAEGLVRGCACRGGAGFAHVSCLAEQAKILYAEAVENNLSGKAQNVRWRRWDTCRLCEQRYHGVVSCALGWACWKTYVGRPEGDWARRLAMDVLGNGLHAANHPEDAVSVMEAESSMMRRLGAPEENILLVQGNLACAYEMLGRLEETLSLRQDVYSGYLKLLGEEHETTLLAANNYASNLADLQRFKEGKSLFRKVIPVARRVLGESHDLTHGMRMNYAKALYEDDGATLDNLREAVTTLEETERTARRVFGGSHPYTERIAGDLRGARAALRARETPSASA